MASSQRPTRTQQRETARVQRQVAAAAAQARQARERRVKIWGSVGVGAIIIAVVAALAFGNQPGSTTDANGVAYVADRADFRLPGLLDNTPVSLKTHAGTPVVVNFFASWCVYCNEELPGFVQVAKATSGKVDFIGVNTDDPGDGAAMAARFGLSTAGFELARDIGGNPPTQLWSSYGSQGLPVTAFYDASGALVDFSGGMLTQQELQDRIKTDFGVSASAPDAAGLVAPVIPVIPQGAYELIRNHPGVTTMVTLDLRPADQFAAGHLQNAVDIAYTAGGFAASVASLDKSASYFLYDASGTEAPAAASAMHDAGFKHVYYVEGGYAAWTGQQLPTTR